MYTLRIRCQTSIRVCQGTLGLSPASQFLQGPSSHKSFSSESIPQSPYTTPLRSPKHGIIRHSPNSSRFLHGISNVPKTARGRSTTPRSSRRHISSSTSNAKPHPPGRLAGQKCLITGASRGIGAAIAHRFAQEGALCTLVGRNASLLQTLCDELGEGHSVEVGDVGSEELWERLRKNKEIKILVNCAGVAHYSPLVATTVSSLEGMVRTNLVGTMLGCKVVGRNMMKNREGCIINVASLLGLKGGRGSAAYAASKAGVIGLTRALSAELGERDVRVNVIVPGYVETDMTDAMTPEAHSAALNAIPLKRFGQPSEIADAALFLATNQYASNCVLNLDGGLSAT